MIKKITIVDVCREAEVSVTTVSKVINNRYGVKESTRRKVLAVIKRLNFTPTAAARNLSSKKTSTVGLILPALGGFVSEFLAESEDAFRAQSYYVLTVVYRENPFDEALKLIQERRVDGIIMFHPACTAAQAAELRKQPVPVLVMNRCAPSLKLNSLVFDAYRGAYQATKHLIDHGYRRIATLTANLNWDNDFVERLRGFKDALIDHGREINDSLIIEGQLGKPGENPYQAPVMLFLERFRKESWPDAVFCVVDEMALELMHHIAGHPKPEVRSLPIVGFSDIHVARVVGLTTIRISIEDFARRAAAKLVAMMKDSSRPIAPGEEVLPVQLVVRASCGCIYPSKRNWEPEKYVR